MTLEQPYVEIEKLFDVGEAIQAGRQPEIPERCRKDYPELCALHKACIQKKPDFRPSFEQVVEELEKNIESSDFQSELTTALDSAHGKWTSKKLPPELEAAIMATLSGKETERQLVDLGAYP